MSAAIRHLHYKPELEELSLWFGPEFRRYKYFGVPQDLYEALRDAPSRGRFFNQFIKGRFECCLADKSAAQPPLAGSPLGFVNPIFRLCLNNSRPA